MSQNVTLQHDLPTAAMAGLFPVYWLHYSIILLELGHEGVLGVCAAAGVGHPFSKQFGNEIGLLSLKTVHAFDF